MKVGPLSLPVSNASEAIGFVVLVIAAIALVRAVWPTTTNATINRFRP